MQESERHRREMYISGTISAAQWTTARPLPLLHLAGLLFRAECSFRNNSPLRGSEPLGAELGDTSEALSGDPPQK